MERILLIDGENLKGKIKSVFHEADKKRPIWHAYDFLGLFNKILSGMRMDKKVFYFARVTEHTESKEKSKQLIEEQRLLKTRLESQGFEVILSGRVRGYVDEKHKSLIFKEKGVDVRIAVDMVTMACDGTVKEIILGSSDSDLQPAIKEVRNRGISCIYLGFEAQPNKGMTFTTNKTILIRNSELFEFDRTLV
ncbi:hypothetical protein A2755_02930 [Candidatus Wolfebacteria bacterium RIFCSPHIGHO2_01_FULL_48_22]|uniref:NYN domain-containing protein n=2 Tax=Candidatus Wolfeibacteriota TaxID=1752735 RepID=A0A1F8DRR8_9BACT|nr:MAG: hypothetical protein A2755_02930 [Candidatus Wolfebacteria bacterium RIFCSPHIGHO2_01_FULL_48_22]OGM92180.1 MAG: hypothetical protein A2935_00135 [Candidatus Wolfebacteria bacterium RIFCSPLOWO2_01_FULL_47_17b]